MIDTRNVYCSDSPTCGRMGLTGFTTRAHSKRVCDLIILFVNVKSIPGRDDGWCVMCLHALYMCNMHLSRIPQMFRCHTPYAIWRFLTPNEFLVAVRRRARRPSSPDASLAIRMGNEVMMIYVQRTHHNIHPHPDTHAHHPTTRVRIHQ